jgi:hypothetical protein
MTTPRLAWRFFASRIQAVRRAPVPSEHGVAVALRNTLPEFLATAAETSIRVELPRTALTCPEPKE